MSCFCDYSDIDECMNNNGACPGACSNTQGSYSCHCGRGFLVSGDKCIGKDQRLMILYNFILVNIINMTLIKTYMYYFIGSGLLQIMNMVIIMCFESSVKFHPSHIHINFPDIDECANRNGKCEGDCVNFQGGYRCDCPVGYYLRPDQESCWGRLLNSSNGW